MGRRARQFGIAVALLAAAFLWWWDPTAPPYPPGAELHAQRSAPADPPGDISPAPSPGRAGRPAPPPIAACVPRAERSCHEGDVYWLDSCGALGELDERCEDRGCAAGRCTAPREARNTCGRTSAYGECAGDVAEACVGDQLVRVDCASRGERCVMTSEGAACLARDDKHGCRDYEPARCERDKLNVCVDGRWRSIDCAARKASCSESGASAHCEVPMLSLLPPLGRPSEQCNHIDDDNDGHIDEGGACDEIPLVAFVPQGARLINLELRMQDELAILNRVFSPTRFRWARTREAPAKYRSFEPKNMELAASTFAQSESKYRTGQKAAAAGDEAPLDFYVAVLFAEKLKLDPPKSGISTLPNARCGGVRVSDTPSPVSGLIVLTEARQPETLAHEMGHYLGLCHTHEQVGRLAIQADGLEVCERTGDSICDTADDPGPPSCFQAAQCELMCRDGARPDPFNIMSYYLGCRRVLTPEQLTEAARNLTLRKAWFRCQDPRACPCDPKLKAACPAEMSCHPGGSGDAPWWCELDGVGAPGTPCGDASQCSARSFCLGGAENARCVRPCDDEAGCTCLDVGLPLRVCAQDLR
jgi:hypothetical protein